MKKKLVNRIAGIATAAILCAGATFAFTGCTTKHPKVTITYNFNNKDYAVTYTLSRYDAPQTVQHFIEVADTGFYDGTCIHNYTSNALYGGGYELNGSSLEEKDYFTAMKDAEKGGAKFTQGVWARGSNIVSTSPIAASATQEWLPTYTVYGEFRENGTPTQNARENAHSFGALVMYYKYEATENSEYPYVRTLRNDGGKGNNGNKYDEEKFYNYNSATSLFYTYLGSTNSSLDQKYCVFGKVDENGEEQLQALIDAIDDFRETLDEDDSFTNDIALNAYDFLRYEPIATVKQAGFTAEYKTPVDKPIVISSVKVTKY